MTTCALLNGTRAIRPTRSFGSRTPSDGRMSRRDGAPTALPGKTACGSGSMLSSGVSEKMTVPDQREPASAGRPFSVLAGLWTSGAYGNILFPPLKAWVQFAPMFIFPKVRTKCIHTENYPRRLGGIRVKHHHLEWVLHQ